MTGFTNYNDSDEKRGGDKSQEEAAATGELEELAHMGRKIGGGPDNADTDQLARDFAEFLKSRGMNEAEATTFQPESLFARLDRIRRESELARAAQQLDMGPGAAVGKGPAGHTADGASRRRDGDPKGDAGKGADNQRSDDPG
jgi:hypothetical protein